MAELICRVVLSCPACQHPSLSAIGIDRARDKKLWLASAGLAYDPGGQHSGHSIRQHGTARPKKIHQGKKITVPGTRVSRLLFLFFNFKCLFHLLGILSSYWWLSLDFLWSPWIQFHKRRLEYRAGGGGGGAGSEAGRHYQFLSSLISSDGWEGRRGYQGTSDAADLPTHTHASRTP